MAKLAGKYLDPSSFANDSATGNDVAVEFILTNAPASDKMLTVSLNGIISKLTTDYSLTTQTVTFITAPKKGQNIIFTYIKG